MEKVPLKTSKSLQTKEHILNTALNLFDRKGYAETTLRDIAQEAEISLGLTYRYYARKEDLVLALYERLSGQMIEQSAAMPQESMAKRFAWTTKLCLEHLQPYRGALGALFAVGLTAESEMAVLGDPASGIQKRMWDLYYQVIRGATDAPKEKVCAHLATVLYASHLLFVLFWLQDRSEGQQKTRELIEFSKNLLKRARPFLGLPTLSKPLEQLACILMPLFGPKT